MSSAFCWNGSLRSPTPNRHGSSCHFARRPVQTSSCGQSTQTSQTSSLHPTTTVCGSACGRILKIHPTCGALGAIFTSFVERRFGVAQCSPDTARSPLGKLGGRVEDGARASSRSGGDHGGRFGSQ